MGNVPASSDIDRGPRSDQTKDCKIGILLFCRYARARNEENQILVGSEIEYCVRVGSHVYTQTISSVS